MKKPSHTNDQTPEIQEKHEKRPQQENEFAVFMQDTIAAIATPPGEGGVGIIRISGPKSGEIGKALLRTPKGNPISLQPRRAHFGTVNDPATGERIDEVLALFMPGPHSYTTQDTLEINCHGGPLVLRRVLKTVLAAGARPAEPGEFTRRAFLGGRLDLAQAEAVMDLIKSRTDQARAVALSQLKGSLSHRINALREDLITFLLDLEVRIDFCEDDVAPLESTYKKERVERILAAVNAILATFDRGKVYREGLRACIIGPPNAGKSTLLNTLLGEDRAIVTPIPGTTRDRIEETTNVGGIPLVLVDTAGIRESDDPVESIGISRSFEAVEQAELALLVLDASNPVIPDLPALTRCVKPAATLVILNKIDLGTRLPRTVIEDHFPGAAVVDVSLTAGTNVATLEDALTAKVLGGQAGPPPDVILSNARHRDALTRTRDYLQRAQASIDGGTPDDCITIDLQGALDALGEITGKVVYEDLIDRIFSQFCIGK